MRRSDIVKMESNSHSKSNRARERWKFLAKVLTKNNNEDDILNNPVSVRRFTGFGLFKSVEKQYGHSMNCDFQTYEYTANVDNIGQSDNIDQSLPRVEIYVRKQNVELQIAELTGFDNTGNICVWPSEEVLAYYLLKHKLEYSGLHVCELGAGMTALAGIMLAASCEVSEVYLTDGNQHSVDNIKKIILNNDFDKTKVHASKLIWDENYTPSTNLQQRFDVIIASDCLFYVKSHKGLLHTIDKLLTQKGKAILMAPKRSGTLKLFCNLAMNDFDVQVIADYDDHVSLKVKEVKALGNDKFEEDLHCPIMVKLQRKDLTEAELNNTEFKNS